MEVSGLRRGISPRFLLAGFEMILVGAIAALLVLIVLRFLTPVGPVGAINADQPLGQGMNTPSAIAVDVFWPASRANETVYQGSWQLRGITFRAGANAGAILSQGKGKKHIAARVGEALNAETMLAEIGRDFVVLETNAGRKRLYLDDAPAVAATNSGAGGALNATPTGLVLPGPLPASSLAQFGLRAGDVLMSVNGAPVESARDLRALTVGAASGETIRVTIRRGTELIKKEIR